MVAGSLACRPQYLSSSLHHSRVAPTTAAGTTKKFTTSHLTSGGPHVLLHGVLMKLVPVFCVRLASLADKPERAVVTSTTPFNSTLRRRHGVAGQVFQPT